MAGGPGIPVLLGLPYTVLKEKFLGKKGGGLHCDILKVTDFGQSSYKQVRFLAIHIYKHSMHTYVCIYSRTCIHMAYRHTDIHICMSVYIRT